MWVFYAAFIALTAYFVWQLPAEWRDRNHPDIPVIVITLVGFSSLIVLITCFYRLPNGWFRTAVLYTESAYFSLLAFTAAVCMFRQVTYYPLHHLAVKRRSVERLAALFDNRRIFMYIVLSCTFLYCAAGFYNMEHLVVRPYTITVDKPCGDDSVRVALLSDLHVGTGASSAQLDRMVNAVNGMEADIIVLAGDVFDSSSSLQDLNCFFAAINRLKSTYGIYYAEGNHEKQCHYDYLPGLEKAGVTVLHDSAAVLSNGLAILGRCDERRQSVPAIRSEGGVGVDMPCIVIQHRPQGLRGAAGTADLFMCGHTHGYQFPMYAFFFPALYNPIEGQGSFGSSKVITTTGVAAWGYHCSWPSKCEIAMIDISFTGGTGHEA